MEYMNFLIRGILAKAQAFAPVYINHYLFMGNHYHMILSGPAKNISPFMNMVDGEIAKLLKRQYPGLYQTKVWEGRFKEQHLGDSSAAVHQIAYTYANPVRANLVAHIEHYPGLNSWKHYRNGCCSIPCYYVAPSRIKPVPSKLSSRDEQRLIRRYKRISCEHNTLNLHFDNWTRRFEDTKSLNPVDTFRMIESELISIQQTTALLRTAPVVGPKRLKQQGYAPDYVPKRDGKTPFLICKDQDLRKILIGRFKAFREACKEAYYKWKLGLISVYEFPKGAYRPGMPLVPIRV
jgi:REP element-mobilizing transposase RayT